MASFGFFSTHIPYIVLAVIYMAYFSVFSLQKIRHDNGEAMQEQLQENDNYSQAATQVFFANEKFSYQDASIGSGNIDLPLSPIILHTKLYPDRLLIHVRQNYSWFSRPPPC